MNNGHLVKTNPNKANFVSPTCLGVALAETEAFGEGGRTQFILPVPSEVEGSETVTKCNRLKMVAEDGKMRLTGIYSSKP